MARDLLCADCAREFSARVGHDIGDLPDDPGWVFRIVHGVARQPTQEQRTITVNGEPSLMSTDEYTCDLCGRGIKPGQIACCRSIFRKGERMGTWESEYLA